MLLYLFLFSPSLQAADNAADLIKVTADTNPKCVTYYLYQGAMYCSTKSSHMDTPINPDIMNYEKQTVVFDHRAWKAALGKKDDTGMTVEYVPMGEDIENWHELITSQYFPGIQNVTTPMQFATTLIENIKKAGFAPIIKFYEKTDDQVIFEFRIESPNNEVQDEIQKVTKGKDGLYVLHYAIKVPDMDQKTRTLWLSNLKKSSPK